MTVDILDATHRRPMRMLEEDVCIGCPRFLIWTVDCGIGVCCAPSKDHDNPKLGNWPATFGQHGIAEGCPHLESPDSCDKCESCGAPMGPEWTKGADCAPGARWEWVRCPMCYTKKTTKFINASSPDGGKDHEA